MLKHKESKTGEINSSQQHRQIRNEQARSLIVRTAPPSPRQTPGPPLPADAPPGAILPALPAPEPRCAGLLPSKHSSALSSRIPRFPAGRCGSVPRAFCIYCSAGARRFLARCSVLPQTGPKTQKSPAAFKNAAELCGFMAKISRSAFQLPLLRGQGWFRGPSCRQGRCRRRGCAACQKGQCPAGTAASRSSCPAPQPWPCRR